MSTNEEPVTDRLRLWSAGDQQAGAQVLPLVYEGLHRIAAREFRRERRDHTLQPTAVVHEAYLRLRGERGLQWKSRAQFFAFAEHLIRRILVDHARQRRCLKRGGRVRKVTLAEAADLGAARPPELVALDDALSTLATLDPRRAAVVELRFFGGFTLEETAARLGISPETAGRDWRCARAWLYGELEHRLYEAPAGVDDPLPEEDPPELAGRLLGAYRLLGRIARGGMGDVYLARRDDGQFDRQVAVKVLRPGLLGTEAQERFHAERKTLARLEHPGIARLYDSGTTPDGRPFLVMERVEGLPIDEYAERQRLAIDARLDLMLAVCAAVDFAHRKRVVHRDLKPDNILVDERGEPKLLDFGVAEPLVAEVPRRRLGGLVRAPWMTPSYASPEQVRGEPATTASDVYALGVVLYELLTGRSPYPDSTTRTEVEAAIREGVPRRPSEVVGGAGCAGGPALDARTPGLGATRAWRRRLRGDLDAIVLKALEKDPRLRYPTAASLAGDLKNYLRGRPVRACTRSEGERAELPARRRGSAPGGALP